MIDFFINKNFKDIVHFFSLSSLMIAIFFLRPMALGEAFTPLSLIVALVAFILFIISDRAIEITAILRRNLLIAACTVIFWIYLVIHALVSGAKHPQYLFSALVTFTFVMCVYSLMLSELENNRKYFTFLRIIIYLFISSYFITLLISLFIPLESLHLFDIRSSNNVDYGDKWGGVYFPLTPAYGITKIFGFTFFRSAGPFREAGIFQAFIIWAFFSICNSEKNSFFQKMILIFGLFASYSTAGILVFGLTAIVNVFMGNNSLQNSSMIFKKIITVIIASCSLVIVFLYMPVFGLIDKLQKSQASINDRIEATRNGLSLLYDNPLGIGYSNSLDPSIGVNFLSAMGLIGLPGVALFTLLIGVSVFHLNSKNECKRYFVLMLPFFLTALIFQPFIDAPLVYIMLFQKHEWRD